MTKTTLIVAFVFAILIPASLTGQSFYRSAEGLFSTRPNEESSLTNIKRFGPVGLGIDLIQPAFTMRISHVEPNSPAEATGKLQAGQIIESINGETLKDIDPRIQLGNLIAAAEATDGKIRLAIKGKKEKVVIEIPVLGAYSETWPLNCPKSDKIVRNFADYLSKPGANPGFGGIGMLFLLSTGEEKDVEVVKKWARSVANKPSTYAWYLGYGGIPLCEYYLRTGDEEVLPGIQKWVDNAVKGQYLDGWAGRGGVPSVTYGMGHLNAGGTAVVTFLMLAKECGADVPDHALLGALVHFYRYAGRGGNPYGDGRPEMGFVDNGKNGNLAFAMAAAAALTPEGEKSVYAKARDVCAMTSFYTTSFMLHGHTGGGIGESWRSPAMGLLYDKRPKQYREFMDNRRWHYELSRRHDGSFGILGGGGYDGPKWNGGWGTAYALTYTIPRKTLRISGAPPTKYSRQFKLPSQPWGTHADNAFLSLESVADENGKRRDLKQETLRDDASRPVLNRLHRAGKVSDAELRMYIFHQDNNIRFVAANKVLGINSGYIGWRSAGGKVRPALLMEFLQHKDPRVRQAMWSAVYEILRRERRQKILTREVFDLAIRSLKNMDEAWTVRDSVLRVLGHAPADWLGPHVDLLLPYLEHEEWWLRNAALISVTNVVADQRYYKKVIPAVGELIRTNQRSAVTLGLIGGIREQIKRAGPEVHQLAKENLRHAFTDYQGTKTAVGGQNIASTYDAHLESIASSLADVPGGLDVLYKIARRRYPNEILPYKQFFLNADPKQFGPELRDAIKPIITDELIPEFVGKNRTTLRKLAAGEIQSGHAGGGRDSIDGLSALHARAGKAQYDWKMFADLRNAEWSYFSFNPVESEQVPWDQLITRYRDVSMPQGMQNWFASDFDAAKAGWQRGKSPFGQLNGKLPGKPIHKCGPGCNGPACYGGTPINTLWEHEVLLMRGTFEIPPLKTGYRYRLRINDGNHVGSGGGHIVYINGKPLIEAKTCNGRGSGGLPKGAYITKEFLPFLEKGKITISVKTFLRYNDKYKVKPSSRVPQGKFSLHFEEQKLPPIGDDLVRKSATVVPMLSSEWQAAQDPNDREKQAAAEKYNYDGTFCRNDRILGKWKTIAIVDSVDAFDPAKRLNARRAPFTQIDFEKNGKTDRTTQIWTGNLLLDLENYEAKKLALKTVDGVEYLFIEVGGFSPRHKPGWKTKQMVLRRD